MSSKGLGIAALAVGCVIGAAGGAYVAVRQNTAAAAPAVSVAPADPASRPVSETEAIIERTPAPAPAAAPEPAPALEAAPLAPSPKPAVKPVVRRQPVEARNRPAAAAPAPAAPAPAAPSTAPSSGPDHGSAVRDAGPVNPLPAEAPAAEPARVPEPPPAPPLPEFDEVVVPASAVIGLQVDTPLSSERARVEDRVEARVTRDVLAAGRVAIPAGSRVYGNVTEVERGGKMKEKARLGLRFHTLVLANGTELPLRTEAIYREGDSPTGESARKIGGAAIGGAIIGAIIGGGKGAATGGAIGAAGGTAAVMAGDRNAATLSAGTNLTVRLLAPLTVEVPRGH